MKRLLWLGVIFLSISWFFLVPFYIKPDLVLGISLVVFGIICTVFSLWKTQARPVNKKYFITLIPLFLGLLVLPFPYNIGIIILIVGILTHIFLAIGLKKEKLGWISLGISLSGVIFIVQTALLPIFSILSAHYHRIDWLSPIVAWIGGLFGLSTTVSNGIVFVQTTTSVFPFTTTCEKLGLFPWLMIFTGALTLLFLIPRKKKITYFLTFVVLSGFYLIIRYVFLIFVFTTTASNLDVFWNPWYILISFIPLMLLLMRFVSLKELDLDMSCFKEFTISRRRVAAVFMIFIFIFSMVGAYAFQDPGIQKRGRVLIDEVHSDWEDTTREMDKEWYGQLSTYNYYCWAEWLNYYYDVDRNVNSTLNSNLLNNYDILIIKCPTNLFSDQEVNDIVHFVEQGGGLYIIGDHTNVFGMNFYSNQLSECFGIHFNYDSTYDLGTGMTSVYENPGSVFAHPIMQSVSTFDFLTSCTLNAPLNAENVILGYKLAAEPGTYSTEYFFRESHTAADMEHGLFLQTVAVKHGQGRVVVFTDSTCFSNFCMFMDGYVTFNLGVMNYLNRSNSLTYVNTAFFMLGLMTFIIAVYLLRKEHKVKIIFLFITVGILAFSVSSPIFTFANQTNYPAPEIRADANFTKICFLRDHSDFVISSSPSASFVETHKLYGTFFVWTQRLGYLPTLEDTVQNAIEGDAIVIINPNKSFKDDEINVITQYVDNGGTILLMDGILNVNSTANELLQNFGMWLTAKYQIQIANITTGNQTNQTTIGNTTKPYLTIIGGNTIFVNEENQTTIAFAEKGKGKVVVMVDSYTFSDSIMGGTFTVPNSFQRSVYDTEFYIFEDVIFGN